MRDHDHDSRSVREPLLLDFVRELPARAVDYRYDATQQLNVISGRGVPVVAAAEGKSLLKTQAVAGED
ncbi:MAG TPA: hypothetical protein VKY22_18785 [Bradyrhizobium sp.]|nr:hypothetical protein [Bradyrhizobium sp.]